MTREAITSLKRGLVAILRGLEPQDAEATVAGLIEAGFEAIEIPLNSPEPFVSIERAVKLAPAGVLIGAGTVLEPRDVMRLHDLGAQLVVSPNADAGVIQATAARGMVSMPGVLSPTEAFVAIKAGASVLKFFPASVLGPAGISAIRAVLPKDMPIGAVGGVGDRDYAAYAKVGIRIFGLGSSLFKVGDTPAAVAAKGRAAVAAYDEAFAA